MEEKDEDEETIVEDVADHKYHKCSLHLTSMVINLSNMTQTSIKHKSNDLSIHQAHASSFQQAQPHDISRKYFMFLSSA